MGRIAKIRHRPRLIRVCSRTRDCVLYFETTSEGSNSGDSKNARDVGDGSARRTLYRAFEAGSCSVSGQTQREPNMRRLQATAGGAGQLLDLSADQNDRTDKHQDGVDC